MQDIYDQACRFAARLDPPGYLRWLLPEAADDLTFVRWLDTRTVPFPGHGNRTCDTVMELRSRAVPAWRGALPNEFQGEPDLESLQRGIVYVGRLHETLRWGPRLQRRYDAVLAVVNLTGRPQVPALHMRVPGVSGLVTRFEACIRTMSTEDAAQTLARIGGGEVAHCMLAWIPLMRDARDRAIIQEWKAVAGQEPSRQLRAEYGWPGTHLRRTGGPPRPVGEGPGGLERA